MTTDSLKVRIYKTGNRLGALTTDGIKCSIKDSPEKELAKTGDQWTARAVSGRLAGQKGLTQVLLLDRFEQGLVDSLPDHWVDPENLKVIQTLLSGNIHVLLSGPPGIGKTMLSSRLAAARNWRFHQVDCAQMLTTKDLFGADSALEGTTRFVKSSLTEWLSQVPENETGVRHLLCLDELNRAQGKAANSLLGLLGPRRQCDIPTIDGTLRVFLPKSVAVIANANLGREYTGTSALDPALRDRMVAVPVGYPPVSETVNVLKQDERFSKIPDVDIQIIVSASRVLHAQFEARASMHAPPSFRGIEATLVLRANGLDLRRSVVSGFMGLLNDREQNDMFSALALKFPVFRPGASNVQ
ncbi:MAG TPA: MoxR family ATPase [Oligoflexia bacterium]|nr:MoxR family ATPase [Oligoflexia bacterium]HMP49427.1 MoxR family ATPase [Oligoflexia bacterium]